MLKTKNKRRLGRFPNVTMILKVKELRKRKMTFRAIGKRLGKDVCTVYRWYKFDVVGIVDKTS